MWQKARIVKAQLGHDNLVGKSFFVLAGPPKLRRGIGVWSNRLGDPGLKYRTNLVQDGIPIGVRQDLVELLPEFAEEVEMEEFDEWAGK